MVTCTESCQSDFSKMRNELGNPACPGEWGTKSHIHHISPLLLFSLHAINPNSRTQTTNLKLLKWYQTRKLVKMQPLTIWTRIYESGLGRRINVPLSLKTFFFNSKKSKSDTWWSIQGITKDHTIGNILLSNVALEFWR